MIRVYLSASILIVIVVATARSEPSGQLELFVDEAVIDRMDGVALRLHSPQPKEVVMMFDRPWEGPQSTYVSVFNDGHKYRMYYRGQGASKKDERVTCYAESLDGITWTRPSQGIHEWKGSKDNNIILRGRPSENFSAFLDARPGVPEDQRYKGVGGGLSALVSGDGIHWQTLGSVKPGTQPLPANAFDSQNVAFWDSVQNQYVCYFRGRRTREDVRAIARTTSPDFITWTDWKFIDLGDSPSEHLYTNAATPYFRAPNIYLAFPSRFAEARQVSDSVFMSSRDGVRFDRYFLEAFLRPGHDNENWTDRNMMIASGILALQEGELSIYWTEHYKHPTACLRRGVLRTDGFVSVQAPRAGGELLTKPLPAMGNELVLNFATSAAGSIRVEVQDTDGKPLPNRALSDSPELYGDKIEGIVQWKTPSPSWIGQKIRFRFVMNDSDLYSIRLR